MKIADENIIIRYNSHGNTGVEKPRNKLFFKFINK